MYGAELFIGRGFCGPLLHAGEQLAHGGVDGCVGHETVGHIDKCEVEACAGWHGVEVALQAVCLADTSAHGHTVDGMAQTFLGHGYEECHRGVAVAAGIGTPHCAQRIVEGAGGIAAAHKELLDGDRRAEFFFLIKAQTLHSGRVGRGSDGLDGLVVLGKVCLDGCCHRRGLDRGSLDVDAQAGILGGLGGGGAECGDGDVALLEVGEIFHQRLDPLRREEHEHVVVEWLVGGEIVADSAVHDGAVKLDFLAEDLGVGAVVHVGNSKEVFLVLVLEHVGKKVGELACGRVENLALAVNDILLQVFADGLGCAEIFLSVGNVVTHLLAEAEEVVDRGFGGEDNGRVFGYGNFLRAEFLGRQPLDLDERTENYVDAIFFGQFIVGRLFG